MAMLKKCFCCSLLTGAVLSGVYATAVYIVAFAVEVWLITEAQEELPTPSYVLCAGYFLLWTLSVALLVGLALRKTKPMLAWILCIIVLFFPECGLVLFMSLYHWTLDTTIGTGELVFWIIRALINIMGLVCVYSLHSQWKEEKNVMRRLRDLTMTTPVITGDIKTPLPGSLRAGYVNSAYAHSQNNIRHTTSGSERFGQLQRSLSTLSDASSLHTDRHNRRLSVDTSANREIDYSAYRYPDPRRTVPGMAYGSMGIAGVGLEPFDYPLGGKSRSMLYIDDVDRYWNRPPISRPMSTALILGPGYQDFAPVSMNRQNQFNRPSVNLRRAHSMHEINFNRNSIIATDVTLQKIVHQPFSYLNQTSKNSLGQVSDDLQRYKDIAL